MRNDVVEHSDSRYALFYDFLNKILKIDPQKRMHPSHAKIHPFIQTTLFNETKENKLSKKPISLVMDENISIIRNVVSQQNEDLKSDFSNNKMSKTFNQEDLIKTCNKANKVPEIFNQQELSNYCNKVKKLLCICNFLIEQRNDIPTMQFIENTKENFC